MYVLYSPSNFCYDRSNRISYNASGTGTPKFIIFLNHGFETYNDFSTFLKQLREQTAPKQTRIWTILQKGKLREENHIQ